MEPAAVRGHSTICDAPNKPLMRDTPNEGTRANRVEQNLMELHALTPQVVE